MPPSGREGDREAVEGARESALKILFTFSRLTSGSFRHANACHLPPGGRLMYFALFLTEERPTCFAQRMKTCISGKVRVRMPPYGREGDREAVEGARESALKMIVVFS